MLFVKKWNQKKMKYVLVEGEKQNYYESELLCISISVNVSTSAVMQFNQRYLSSAFTHTLLGIFISAVIYFYQSFHVFQSQLSSVFIHIIWYVYLSCDMSVSKLLCVSISAVLCPCKCYYVFLSQLSCVSVKVIMCFNLSCHLFSYMLSGTFI